MTNDERIDWLCRLRSEVQLTTFPKEWKDNFIQVLTDAIKDYDVLGKIRTEIDKEMFDYIDFIEGIGDSAKQSRISLGIVRKVFKDNLGEE